MCTVILPPGGSPIAVKYIISYHIIYKCLHVSAEDRVFSKRKSFTEFGPICERGRRSQWPRGLRRRSAAARLLRSWVRIPPGAWMFVCCECCVLLGRGLCDELITRPEESYRLWCVVVCDLETSRICAQYIYDIRSLRINDLTLILLTWRKWWANNASK